jgi:CheY-like chemotaxis protein
MLKILWVDNDPAYISPYIEALEDRGSIVTVVTTAIDAESALNKERYDLLILDVMIPTKSEREEEIYHPEETEYGLKTGLIFYRRNKERLTKTKTQILVVTVRLDKGILDEFMEEGLPRECFSSKLDLSNVEIFLDRVAALEANR